MEKIQKSFNESKKVGDLLQTYWKRFEQLEEFNSELNKSSKI